jgi:hypothetical protein
VRKEENLAKVLLDDLDYKVMSAGFWRGVWSIIMTLAFRYPRGLEWSNFLIVDKHNNAEFRLTEEEQDFLDRLSRHLNAMWMAPDFDDKERVERSKIVYARMIYALVDARKGDKEAIERLKSMNHCEYVEWVWKVADL